MMKMRKINQSLKGIIDQADNEEEDKIFILNVKPEHSLYVCYDSFEHICFV